MFRLLHNIKILAIGFCLLLSSLCLQGCGSDPSTKQLRQDMLTAENALDALTKTKRNLKSSGFIGSQTDLQLSQFIKKVSSSIKTANDSLVTSADILGTNFDTVMANLQVDLDFTNQLLEAGVLQIKDPNSLAAISLLITTVKTAISSAMILLPAIRQLFQTKPATAAIFRNKGELAYAS